MSNNKRQAPRRRDYSSDRAYERARRIYIREIRRKRRMVRNAIKYGILAAMALTVGLVCFGIYSAICAIFGIGAVKVEDTILGARTESMPDISKVKVVEPDELDVPQIDLTICLDPGHGGIDPGTSDVGQTRFEKDDVFELATAAKEELEKMGAKVVMTRDDDTFLDLTARATYANEKKADYMISIHRNAVEDNYDVQGIEIYAQVDNEEAYQLATNIMDGFEDAGITQNRGVREGRQDTQNYDYQVNRLADMPACLIEMGFMTNDEDNQLFDDNMEGYAKAIAKAVALMVLPKDEVVKEPDGAELHNETIMDVDTIEATEVVWAPGPELNDVNVPTGVVQAQKDYDQSQAYFYKSNAGKEIFLTFDVGHEAGYTDDILDILRKEETKAVFFVTLPFAKGNPKLIQRMIDEGHVIGNRSATYPKDGMALLSLEKQKKEIKETHEYLLEHFNYRMTLFRFPDGKFSKQALAVVNNLNYASVFWSFSYQDFTTEEQPKADDVLEVMVDRLHSGGIYLMSVNSKTNVNILKEFISQTQNEGYELSLFSAVSTGSAKDNETEDQLTEPDQNDEDESTEE